MASTFLTLVYVPILYSLFDELKEKAKGFLYSVRLVKRLVGGILSMIVWGRLV